MSHLGCLGLLVPPIGITEVGDIFHECCIIVGAGIVSLDSYSAAFILTAWANQIFIHWKDDMLEDQFERELWVFS
jgi:hypothetical protein